MPQTISENEVRHVAKLARLKLTDEEVRQFTVQLGDILAHMEKLKAVDVADVEPMAHPMQVTSVMRDDVEQPGMAPDAILANAPDRSGPFFKVVKVLGEQSGA